MSGRFAGKSIVITGGGAGLGRECALQWGAEGGRIVVTDLVEDRAHAVAKEVEAAGGDAVGLKTDVRIEAEVEQSVAAAVENFGRLDIMFANAGRSLPGGPSIAETTEEQWDDVTNTVFRGVFFSGKHAFHQMKKQRSGNIVVTTSAAGHQRLPRRIRRLRRRQGGRHWSGTQHGDRVGKVWDPGQRAGPDPWDVHQLCPPAGRPRAQHVLRGVRPSAVG